MTAEVHQIVLAAAPGDAVTNSALECRALLRQHVPSDLFAAHVHPDLADDVLPLHAYEDRPCARRSDAMLLYHLSIGGPEVVSFLFARRERVGIVYHNITPARFFAPYDAEFAAGLELGYRELDQLRQRASFALAVSPFNARELRRAGYTDVDVVPLVVDVDRLRRITPDEGLTARLADIREPVVLYVGQMFPHKRPDLLLAAHHVASTYLELDSHLVMVGVGRLERYRRAVHRFADDLNLPRVWMTGPVPTSQLVAFYRRADVFATMSEHEGFCAPILEAMGFDVPVVARRFAAIPDTADDAALLLPPTDDPVFAAEAIAEVLCNQRLHADLVARGRRNVADHDPAAARQAFTDKVLARI